MSFALSSALTAVLAGAPMVDVSPFAMKHQSDGSLEYSYDLTLVKSGGGTPDAINANGEEKVKAFLKSLPRTLKVVVSPGAPIEVSAGRPIEPGKLTTAFATIADGPMASDHPLSDKKGARLRPAFDPQEPHLLLSAEALAWEVRQQELAALAAEEVDTEVFRRELWNKVLELSLSRIKSGQGDAKEGAIALAARVAAGNSCLDKTKVAPNVRADGDASAAVDAEIARALESPDALIAPQPWSWRPELTCAWVRSRVMGLPFERSRAGTGAVLIFLDLLQKDPKLAATWDKLRSRRDRFLGTPKSDGITLWKERANGNPGEALERLNDFIESLPMDDRVPPALLASASTPFASFLAELSGAERAHASAELVNAIADGRVNAASDTWPNARDAALAPLCRQDKGKTVQFDGDWRERLQASFSSLVGSAGEARGSGVDADGNDAERSELQVRLLVPPAIEVEPLSELFAREADSLQKLVEALTAEKMTGLTSLAPDGSRGGPIVATAKVWIPRLRGLASLANPEAQAAKDLGPGRQLAAAWRSEPAFSKDVREVSASPVSMPADRHHAAILGVSRRELSVSFTLPPKMQLTTPFEGAVLEPSEQRYIVPVLISAEAPAPPTKRPMDRAALKALIDGVQREPTEAEGAFVEAVRQP
jgi:hypothetical protein